MRLKGKNLFQLTLILLSFKSISQVYRPINLAALAASEDCYYKMFAYARAGNNVGFQNLQDSGCILLYESDRMNFNLILFKLGGVGKPNIYFIQGKPQNKIWANGSQMIEISNKKPVEKKKHQ